MKRSVALIAVIGMCLINFSAQLHAWPVPDTGQQKCYDAEGNEIDPCPQSGEPFYGQDANYVINPMSYTKLDANGKELKDDAAEWAMVRDDLTGLIWEVKQNKDGIEDYTNPHDSDNEYTWYNSDSSQNGGDPGKPGDGTDTEDFINAINSENYGGYSDWRLPEISELQSIFNYNIPEPNPTVSVQYFKNTNTGYYWSTYSLHSTLHAWAAHFQGSAIQLLLKDESYFKMNHYVRGVRGGKTNFPDKLIDNGDGTVTDQSTGLMWQQDSSGEMNWQDALIYCETLTLAGYDDWRLPNLKELVSIVDYYRYGPAINLDVFSLLQDSTSYWTSTSNATQTNHAISVGFWAGNTGYWGKSRDFYIRAVRGGSSINANLINITPVHGTKDSDHTIWGEGYTPNGQITIRAYTYPDRIQFDSIALQATSQGNFSAPFYAKQTEPGEYLLTAEDVESGQGETAQVTYKIWSEPPPSLLMGPLTGPQGTIFSLGGNGFTSNQKATLIVKNPAGNEIVNEEIDINSDGGIQYSLEIAEDAPTGEYVWWAVDNATNFKAVEMTFAVTDKEISLTPATPVAPGNHEEISGNAYTFEWSHPHNDEYEVTIKDESGNTVLTSARTTEKSVSMDLSGLTPDNWYKWTITVYANDLSQVSAENFFTYLGSASDITPPTLEAPANESKIVTSYEQDKHMFSWTHPFDDEYQVVIVNDQEQEFHRSEMTTEKSIEVPTYNDLGKGVGETYYWYVVVKTDDKTDASDRFSFQYYKDTDSDGLLDDWEINGYDTNGDNKPEVDLPQMGADPYYKDIFLEIDYMSRVNFWGNIVEYRPSINAIERLVDAFARAPVPNIGAADGVHLHVDVGPDYRDRYNKNADHLWGGLSRSDAIAHHKYLTDADANGNLRGAFEAYESVHFLTTREKIFRYCLYVDRLWRDDPENKIYSTTSGFTLDIPGTRFIVSLGGWGDEGKKDIVNIGTIMHELGHSLGLNHGGLDDEEYQIHIDEFRGGKNWKPNHLSIMNYAFQFNGLKIKGIDGYFDYSRFNIPALEENNLNETIGISMPNVSSFDEFDSDDYCTIFVDPDIEHDQSVRKNLIAKNEDGLPLYLNRPINWDNDNNDAYESNVAANINGDFDENENSVLDTLRGTVNEWENLIYEAGTVGAGISLDDDALGAPADEFNSHPETTYEEYLIMPQPFGVNIFQDMDSIVTEIGAIDQHSVWIKNTGDNTDIFELNYSSSLGWFNPIAIPGTVSLESGESHKIDFDLYVPAEAHYGDVDTLSIQATSQGNPNFSDSLRFHAKVLQTSDINGDGLIHIGDVVQLRSHLFGVAGITGHPDANGDGRIDEFDVDAVIDEIFATEVPSSENTQTIRAGISVVAPEDLASSQFSISVALDDPVQQTTAAQFDVVFDDSLVEMLSINKAELSSDYDFKHELYEPGRLRVLIYPSVPEADFYDISGEIANLDMEISNGQGPIDIKLENVFLSEIHGKSYRPDVITNATIEVDGAPGSETIDAEAGSSQTVDSGATATLNGSGSTTGAGITYQWTQTAGPSVTLTDANSIQASFTAPDVTDGSEILTFRLTVSDADGNTATDTTTVTVSVQDAGEEPDDDHDGPGDTNNCFINSVFH